MKYRIEITETLSRIIDVEASNQTDAIRKIKYLYSQEKIVLDSNDHLDTKIDIYKE